MWPKSLKYLLPHPLQKTLLIPALESTARVSLVAGPSARPHTLASIYVMRFFSTPFLLARHIRFNQNCSLACRGIYLLSLVPTKAGRLLGTEKGLYFALRGRLEYMTSEAHSSSNFSEM